MFTQLPITEQTHEAVNYLLKDASQEHNYIRYGINMGKDNPFVTAYFIRNDEALIDLIENYIKTQKTDWLSIKELLPNGPTDSTELSS